MAIRSEIIWRAYSYHWLVEVLYKSSTIIVVNTLYIVSNHNQRNVYIVDINITTEISTVIKTNRR